MRILLRSLPPSRAGGPATAQGMIQNPDVMGGPDGPPILSGSA
ncbi:hypothetical protein M2281_005586 [Mesorhizobium soli]|nr:hypothetical protein [Mesorhizobium soli]MDH6234965.1 hypothetical protein [Mesorhizobium soli]